MLTSLDKLRPTTAAELLAHRLLNKTQDMQMRVDNYPTERQQQGYIDMRDSDSGTKRSREPEPVPETQDGKMARIEEEPPAEMAEEPAASSSYSSPTSDAGEIDYDDDEDEPEL